jgi:small-conductance mechanosensitive channel
LARLSERLRGGAGGWWLAAAVTAWALFGADVAWADSARGWRLEREPLGFDLSALDLLREDLGRVLSGMRGSLESFEADSGGWLGRLWRSAPLYLVLALAAAVWWLDSKAQQARQLVWGWLPPVQTPWLDHSLDSFLRVLAAVLPMALGLIPAYVPLRLLYPDAVWLEVVILALWVALVYRGLKAVVEEVLLGDLLDLSRKPMGLKRWFDNGLKVGVILWGASQAGVLLGGAGDVYFLLRFLLRLWITLHVLRLAVIADEVRALLPLQHGARPDDASHAEGYLKAFIGFASLMLLLWSVGYQAALSQVLWRVSASLGVLLISLLASRRIQRFIHAYIDAQLSPDGEPVDREKHAVLSALDRSVVTVGGALLAWLMLSTLGLWQPLVDLTSMHALELGKSIRISLFLVVRGVFLMLCFLFLSNVVRALLYEKVYPRFEVDIGVGYAINTMVHYLLFLVGLLLGLDSLGVDVAALGLFLSALGIGIGLGLQPIVKNLMGGFILLFGRSIKKGDFITVNEVYGRVDTVGARSVTLTTPDNVELIVPSADLISLPVLNWTLSSPLARIKLPVRVAHDTDPRRAQDALLSAALRHPRVQRRPAPEVWVIGLEASCIQLQLLIYIDCRQINETRIVGELYYHIWDALHEAHIQIPFEQTDLHIRSLPPGASSAVASSPPPVAPLSPPTPSPRRDPF